jgi:hypothetical protein
LIYWDTFTWEAFATIFTGLVAVGGAAFVGLKQAAIARKQAEISERQTMILGQQVGLDELKLRADLFDLRFPIYEATRAVLGAVMTMTKQDDRWPKYELDFLVAKDQATFLFRPSVASDLQAVWGRICARQALQTVMAATYAREGHYGEGNPDRELEHSLWLTERLTTLSDLFGDELTITAHRPLDAAPVEVA